MSDFTEQARLVVRLARREMRGGIRGFRVFIACLTLGVAAIACVGSLSHSIKAGLQENGKLLLGGDVDIRLLHQPLNNDQRTYFEQNAAQVSEVIDMRAMARSVSGKTSRQLIELKAVDQNYPLVGSITIEPAQTLDQALSPINGIEGAIVDANLLTRLKLHIGDKVRVGSAEFEIRGKVVLEPDRVASVFSFGPRLMIRHAAIESTGLIQPGSQIHYHTRLAFTPGTGFESWRNQLDETFPDAGWRVRSPDQAAPGVNRFLDRMTLFMSFVGLTVLLVGAIGVGNAVKSYLDEKTSTIATLKCLGAPGHLIFALYFLQVMVLGFVGVVLGLIIGAVLPMASLSLLSGQLPVAPVAGIYFRPLIEAATFGMMTAATFALWPVARARDIKAADLFRDTVAPLEGGLPRRRYMIAYFVGILLLAGLTLLTAGDHSFALWFIGGSIMTILLLRLGARLIMSLAKKVPRSHHAEWRMALANLHRPGTSTPQVVLALGIGISVLVAVTSIEGNLDRQISERLPDVAPAFFFIDIQPSQIEAFDKAVTSVEGAKGYRRVATMRGRITKINGTPVSEATISSNVAWAVRGDRALTFSAKPLEGAEIVKGAWWVEDYSGPPAISLDAGIARGFGIDLGDTLTLNVLGRQITAEIKSLREIDWRSLRFDFAIIFAPGTLENAPHTHIAAIEATPEAENAVEAAATDKFANVSAIRVREALAAAATMIKGVGAAVNSVAAVTILAGALVLAGTIIAGNRRRTADAVVFKVLGATRKRILRVYLMEYSVLGLATGIVGAAVGTLTSWAVVVFLMQTDWVFLPTNVLITTMLCLLVAISVGISGTWHIFGLKTARYLRNE